MIAAVPEDLEDFRSVLHGIELRLDGIRPGHHQAERKGRRKHLNEYGFHESANSRTATPHTNNTKRQFDGYGFLNADTKYFVKHSAGIYLAPSMR